MTAPALLPGQHPQPAAPTLSIVVLNYNYGHYVGACIEAILAQTFDDFELIVIDDCSPDDSVRRIAPFTADPRVRFVQHQQNLGFVESLIEGTELLARGKYVVVISADDAILDREAFRKQIDLLETDGDIAFCFSSYQIIDGQGTALGVQGSFATTGVFSGVEWATQAMSSGISVLHSGAMVRTSAFRACGGYRRDMRYCVDFALFMTLPLYGKVAYLSDVLYGYRKHATQMSGSLASALPHMQEVRAAIDSIFQITGRRRLQLGISRSEALRVFLAAEAVSDASGDRHGVALARLYAGLRTDPLHMISSRRFWIALTRMGLGKSPFEKARSIWRGLTDRARSTLASS